MRIKYIFPLLLFVFFFGCKSEAKKGSAENQKGKVIPVEHASGFTITDYGNYKILTVKNPWPQSNKTYTYLLSEKNADIPEGLMFDQKVTVPVKRIVVTSTTHISSLEILNEEKALVGFPGLDYISSQKTRNLIAQKKVRELGENESLNTEILLELQPDVVVGFAVDGSNKNLSTIEKSGIPVVFNSDWVENSPLGKAEWIKFFGAFFNKTEVAVGFFNKVASSYSKARELAKNSTSRPSVLAGAMYKDQWYLPYGDSWHARFFKDANAQYIFSGTSGSGSMALSLESVLSKAERAEFWIGPAQFQSYQEMAQASKHYARFSAFRNKNIFTFSSVKGETGGVLFYEIAPTRPDLVLKDLISIFHPGLLPDHKRVFYQPLR